MRAPKQVDRFSGRPAVQAHEVQVDRPDLCLHLQADKG